MRRRINEGWKSGRRAQHKFERTEGPSPEVNSILASWSELRETRGLKKGKTEERIGKRKKRERKGERETERRGGGYQDHWHRHPTSTTSPSLPFPPSIHAAPCNHHYSHATIHQLPDFLPNYSQLPTIDLTSTQSLMNSSCEL